MPSLREERADRTIDHPRGQRGLLTGARLAAEEGAGDLARGVVLFLNVNGEGEEVHIAVVPRCGGAEDHRVAGAHHDGATRLSGELSGLEGNLLAAYFHRDSAYVEHAHMSCIPSAVRLTAFRLRTLVLCRAHGSGHQAAPSIKRVALTRALASRAKPVTTYVGR